MPDVKIPGLARADLPELILALDVLMDNDHRPHVIGPTPQRQELRDRLQEDLNERTA